MTGEEPLTLSPLVEADLDDVLALNQRWVPHVGELDRGRLADLVERCTSALVARGEPASVPGPDAGRDGDSRPLAGFVLVLGPGAGYASPNYRFFADRHRSFRYVDRIAVAPGQHRRGLGRRLYAAVVDHARAAGAPVVCAEVNVDPPNPDSQRFHAALGFVEVGRQWTYDDRCQVQLLELAV